MKRLVSSLAVVNDPSSSPGSQQTVVLTVLDSLLQILRAAPAPRELFAFSGKPGCGIGLLARETLPKEGYCFCGWIRVERRDQSAGEEDGSRMTVFKLGASKDREVELFVRDGFLSYSVSGLVSCWG